MKARRCMSKVNSLLLAWVLGVCTATVQAQSISVSITPTDASLLVTGQQEFTAAVTGDLFNGGVTWTVAAASGTVCAGTACGTVSPTSTASGVPTAYDAPPTAPNGGRVIVTATSVSDPTKAASATVTVNSAANDAGLNGDYAFTFNGMKGGGSFIFSGVGRLTADGQGNVTNGELDINASQYPGPVVVQQTFTGTYAIGTDKRGVMAWNIPSNDGSGGTQRFAKLAFAIKGDGSAVFTVWDPVIGRAEFGSGTLQRVDITAYKQAQITGDYAFGAAGFDRFNNRAGVAGRLTADGAGDLINVDAVLNDSGSVFQSILSAGTYGVSDPTTGRGVIRLVAQIGPMPTSLNFVFYVVNAGKLFILETDAYAIATPLLNGVMLHQQVPSGGFSPASLQGGTVLYLGGGSICDGGNSPTPKVLAGLVTTDGSGAAALTYDQNCGGTSTFSGNQSGTYTVSVNGHSCITVGTNEIVAYLVNSNQAFLLGTDSSALFGFGESQTAGALANNAVMGRYAGFTSTLPAFSGSSVDGEFTADGASPSGTLAGSEDILNASGPSSGVTFNGTYSISPSPTNGRGTLSVSSGAGGSAAIYVISPSKFIAVPLDDPSPALLIFQQ